MQYDLTADYYKKQRHMYRLIYNTKLTTTINPDYANEIPVGDKSYFDKS